MFGSQTTTCSTLKKFKSKMKPGKLYKQLKCVHWSADMCRTDVGFGPLLCVEVRITPPDAPGLDLYSSILTFIWPDGTVRKCGFSGRTAEPVKYFEQI